MSACNFNVSDLRSFANVFVIDFWFSCIKSTGKNHVLFIQQAWIVYWNNVNSFVFRLIFHNFHFYLRETAYIVQQEITLVSLPWWIPQFWGHELAGNNSRQAIPKCEQLLNVMNRKNAHLWRCGWFTGAPRFVDDFVIIFRCSILRVGPKLRIVRLPRTKLATN